MTLREEIKKFKQDLNLDKYLTMLASNDEDNLKLAIGILQNDYPKICKHFEESLAYRDYKNDPDYGEARVVDYCRSQYIFKEFLKLFNKNQLLKDCLKNSIRNEGIGK